MNTNKRIVMEFNTFGTYTKVITFVEQTDQQTIHRSDFSLFRFSKMSVIAI